MLDATNNDVTGLISADVDRINKIKTVFVYEPSAEKPYKCMYLDCTHRYYRLNKLEEHFFNHRENPRRPLFACNSTSKLKQQMLTKHSEELPFKCKDCNYRYINEENYRSHLKIHAGEIASSSSNCKCK